MSRLIALGVGVVIVLLVIFVGTRILKSFDRKGHDETDWF